MSRPTCCTIIAVASFVLTCSFALQAQNSPPAHPPRPKAVGPAKWVTLAQQVSVAYWTLEPGWSTTIEMRNNVAYHDLTVTPVLRSETGRETALTPVTIAPQHIVSFDLGSAAGRTGKAIGPFGSLVFRFNGLDAANLFAATIVQHAGEPIDFHFDGRDASPSLNSNGVEGLWWIPSASSTDYLILSNPLSKTVTGSLTLSSGFASHRPLAISLGPGQVKRIDVREVLGASSNGSVGGITLTLPNKELIWTTQIVFDETTGFSAMMKMFERLPDDKAQQRVLRAPMMAMMQPDAGLGFPSGTLLVPQLFLRNASPATMQVATAIDWRDQNSGTFALPTLSLAPGEIKTIRLADYQQAGQIPSDANWASVRLSYAGQRSDLVAVAASYDKSGRYGLQTPFSEDLSRVWAGGMWHVDATHNTFITTGNGGSEATTAEVTLFYNGGKSKYRIEKLLVPGQQLWLDLGHLVHDQIPDSDGSPLPPETMTGSYELRDLDHAYVGQLYEGKLVIDKTYGHAAYGCGSCCGYDAVVLDPNPFGGPPGIDNSDFIYANDTCSGTKDDVTDSGYSWASSNTGVATLPTRTLHTVAVGTATGSALAKLQWAHPPSCPTQTFGPQQPVQVCNAPNTASTALYDPLNLSSVYPNLLSGIGNVAKVTVGPSGTTWNGQDVTETVTSGGTNTCPSGFPTVCSGSTVFTIGEGYQPAVKEGTNTVDVGPLLVGTTNVFFDQYSVTSNQSLLDYYNGGSSCQITCSQQYFNACTTQGQLLDHTFTYTFTKSTINGTKVTLVTVSE